MKRKSIIITFLILIFTMMLNLGYSAWLILKDKQIDPGYDQVGIYNYIEDNQSVVYNGNEQVPVISEELTTDISSFSYEYKIKGSDDSFIDGKPTNVGTYTMNISSSIFGVAENITFTITKATPLINSVTPIYNQVSAKDATKYYDGYFTTAMVTSDIDFEYDIKGVKNEPLSGSLTYTDTRSKLEIGTVKYSYKFIPESANYNEVVVNFDEEKAVSIVTYATVNFINGNETILTIEVAKDSLLSDGFFNHKQNGYELDGWYFNDTKWNFDTDKVVTDMTLIARWNPIEYTITYNLVGGQLPEGITNKKTYTIKETFTINNPIKSGYTFAGWDVEYVGEKDHYHTELDFTYSEQTPNLIINVGTFGDLSLTAIWLAREYDITYVNLENAVFDLNGNPSSINPNPLKIKANETIPLINPTGKRGYNFAGWTLKDEDAPNLQMTLSNVRENLTITAHWTPIEYTIKYNLEGGSLPEGITNPTSYNIESKTFTLNNPVKEGYEFTGWSGWTLEGNANMQVSIPQGTIGHIEFTAHYQLISYNITYELNGGFFDIEYPITYNYEQSVTLVPPTKNGYKFIGWTGENGITPEINVSIPVHSTGDKHFIANWEKVVYNITYYDTNLDATLGCVDNTYPLTYTIETDVVTIPNATKDGYTFNSWSAYSDVKDENDLPIFTFNGKDISFAKGSTYGNLVFIASFDAKPFTIEYDLNDNTNVKASFTGSDVVEYYITSTITIPNPTRPGYGFGGWTIENKDPNGPTSFGENERGELVITNSFGNLKFTATWDKIPYNITFYDVDGKTQIGTVESYDIEMTSVSETELYKVKYIPTKEGYVFMGWECDDITVILDQETGLTNILPFMTYGNLKLTAIYNVHETTINYELNGGNYYDNEWNLIDNTNPIKLSYEQSHTLVNPSKPGYDFEGWTLNGNIITVLEKLTEDEITLVANWSNPKTYTISYFDGAVDVALGCADETYPTSYNITTPLTIPNASKTGYTFNGWSVTSDQGLNAYKVTSTTSVTINPGEAWGNLTFIANFTINNYKLTFVENGGTPEMEDKEIEYNTKLDLPTANDISRNGYEFGGWYTDEGLINEAPTHMPDNPLTLYAKWTEKEYKIKAYDKTIYFEETDTYQLIAEYSYKITDTQKETPLTIPNPSKDGYTFAGWADATNDENKDMVLGASLPLVIPTDMYGNIEIYATWSIIMYSIEYDYQDKESVSKAIHSDITEYQISTVDIKIVNPVRHGYEFLGWDAQYVGEKEHSDTNLDFTYSKDNPETTLVIPTGTYGDIKLTALWKVIDYTVSIIGVKADDVTFDDTGLNGSFNDATGNYEFKYTVDSQDITILAPEKVGYTFSSWTISETYANINEELIAPIENTKNYVIPQGTYGDVSLTAVFGVNMHKLTFVENGGLPEIEDKKLAYNTELVLPTENDITRNGYTFEGWYVDTSLNEAAPTHMPDNSLTLYAKWTPITYTVKLNGIIDDVTFDSTGLNGTLNGDVYKFSYTIESSNITVINPTREGYVFLGWADVNNNNNLIDNIIIETGSTGDKEYTAKWDSIIDISSISLTKSEFTYQKETIHSVSINEETIPEGLSYTIDQQNSTLSAENAGNYVVTVVLTANDNYTLIVNGEIVNEHKLQLPWIINKCEINFDEVNWNYNGPYEFNGSSYEVTLDTSSIVAFIDGVTYNGNSETNANTVDNPYYTATATINYDTNNYIISGNNNSNVFTLEWIIDPMEVDLSEIKWDVSKLSNDNTITYTGNDITVEIDESTIPSMITVIEKDNVGKEVGKYTSTADSELNDGLINSNYKFIGEIPSLIWNILPASTNFELMVEYDNGAYFTTDKVVSEIKYYYLDGNEKIYPDGTVTLKDENGNVINSLSIGDYTYKYEFVPTDNKNYSKSDGKLNIVVYATVKFVYNANTVETKYVELNGIVTAHDLDNQLGYKEEVWKDQYGNQWDFNNNVQEDLTLTAYFEIIKYTISYYAKSGDNTSLLKPVVEYTVEDLYKNNGSYTINYDPTNDVDNEGKTFTGWTGSNGNIPSKTFSFTTSELGDKEYYANWTIEVSIDDFLWNYDASDIDTWTYDSTTKYVEFNSTKHSEYIEVIYSGDLRGQKNVKSMNESYKTVATLTIKDEYKDSVTIVGANTSTLEWKIFPKVINYSDFEWQDENTFTYTGSTIKVSLKDVPNYLTVQYSNNTGTDVNEYTAEVVSITLSDSSNCNYVINKDQDIEPFNWYITTIFDTSKLFWSAGDDTDILQDETNKLLFTTVFDNDYHYLTINDNIIPSAIEKVYSFEDDKGNTIVDEKTIKNAGTYTFSIILKQNKVYGIYEDTTISATLIINKAPVSPSWDYNSETEFIYIKGKTYAVGIVNEENVIDGINLLDIYTITYTNNEKEEANNYTATAIFTIKPIYAGNFEIDPDFNYELQWKINPKEINVGDIYQWNYKENEPLLYNGKEQSVSLEFKEGLTDDIKTIVDDAKITINYEGNKATQIGNEYEAKVVSITAENKNYKITNIEAIQPLKWAIVPSTIKLEGLTWGEFDATYNGQTHNITISGDVLTNNPNYVPTITYTPVDENENPTGDEASTNGIINAGKYKVSVVFNDANGNSTLTHELADKIIEIKKAKPTITLTAKDNCGYEHNIESNVKGSINVTLNGISISENEHEKITITTSELSISEYYAANENGEQTKYNGSANSNQIELPIKVNVTHNNPNYEQLSETIVNVSINAVAHNGNGTYYSTIERALSLAGSGTTVYVIPNLGIDVPIRKNIIIASGVTLALPFEGTTYNGRQNGKDSSKWFDDNGTGTGTCVSNVVIEQNVKVEVNGTLAIGGILGHEWIQRSGHTSGNHASITMKDNSSIISSGNIYCYGFIYDSSSSSKPSVVSISSGKLYMPFVIYDYKGGKSTVGAYQSGHIVPFNIFDMPNIYSTVTVSSSAELWGMADLFTGALSIAGIINVDPQHNNTDTKIIGSSSALINLNSNAYATFNYNGSYTTLKLFGGASFGSLSLTVSVAGITRTVETSEIYFPISYKYEIELDGNGTYTMNHKMKLLPGSEIYVNSGSSLDIGSSGEMIVYDEFPDKSTIYPYPSYGEAKLIVDGNLNIDGSFGGTIYTNNRSNNSNSAAKINISSSASLSLSSLEGDGDLDTSKAMGGFLTGGLEGAINAMSIVVESTKWTTYQQANGNIANVDGELFETGNTYYSRYVNSECTWYKPGDASIYYNSNYNSVGGSNSIYAIESIYISINSGGTIPSDINTAIIPEAPAYYQFDGWYLNQNCSTGQEAPGKIVWGATNLYAKWRETTYSITYNISFSDGSNHDLSNINSNPNEIAKNQTINLVDLEFEGYEFSGWYLDGTLITSISSSQINKPITLTATFVTEETPNITLVYDDGENITGTSDMTTTSKVNDNYVISQTGLNTIANIEKTYNSDELYERYIKRWYYLNSDDEKITFTPTTPIVEDMTIYAEWENKYKLTYNEINIYDNSTISSEVSWYTPNSEYLLKTNYDKSGYIFNKFTINGNTYNSDKYTIQGNTSYTVYYHKIITITFDFSDKVKSYTISIDKYVEENVIKTNLTQSTETSITTIQGAKISIQATPNSYWLFGTRYYTIQITINNVNKGTSSGSSAANTGQVELTEDENTVKAD